MDRGHHGRRVSPQVEPGGRHDASSAITLTCFGLVGTLIADDGLLERAFAEAIATQGVVSGTSAFARCMAQVQRARGQAPGDILASLFPGNLPRAQAAMLAYDRSLAGALARTAVAPIPGATEILGELAQAGCRICVMTTVPRRELAAIVRAAGWRDLANVALTADDVPRGCPSPDLALAAMLRVGVGNVREIAVVHATGAGVECDRRAHRTASCSQADADRIGLAAIRARREQRPAHEQPLPGLRRLAGRLVPTLCAWRVDRRPAPRQL